MKKTRRILSVFALVALLSTFTACDQEAQPAESDSTSSVSSTQQITPSTSVTPITPTTQTITEEIDYASEVKLDWSSETLKKEVTVKTYVDGDTTHFHVDDQAFETGVLKARYLAINTPESTGKIEEWGKKASDFTKAKLKSAQSIVIESDDNKWNADSTGGRYLVWVWYRTSETSEYRNLNIEILQNGLAIASNSANNRYGVAAVAAINQAKILKYNIYSGQKDPGFYYGQAHELTLKELRCNVSDYVGQKVAFEGIVTRDYSQTVYVEEYDDETDIWFGMAVYYGFSASGDILDILSVGNRVRIVGTVSYYEAGGTYQVSGLTYRAMKPNDPSNCQKLGDGYTPANKLTTVGLFNSTVSMEFEEEIIDEETGEVVDVQSITKNYPYGELAMNSSIKMENLKVNSIYTTDDPASSSIGAMTIRCKDSGGNEVTIRTVVLKDDSGKLITENAYLNKTITVVGVIDCFNGSYQIKVLTPADITVNA